MYITVEPVLISLLLADGEEPETEYASEILLPNISSCLIPARQLETPRMADVCELELLWSWPQTFCS